MHAPSPSQVTRNHSVSGRHFLPRPASLPLTMIESTKPHTSHFAVALTYDPIGTAHELEYKVLTALQAAGVSPTSIYVKEVRVNEPSGPTGLED